MAHESDQTIGAREAGGARDGWDKRTEKREKSVGHAAGLCPGGVRDAHLVVLLHDVVKDGLVCRLFEAALGAGLVVLFVSVAKSFGTEVESIAKRLVDALQSIPLSHEDSLECRRACSRVSSHKDGLVGHGCGSGRC
jgi:hypothetical protein